MHVDLIVGDEAIEALEANWNSVFAADPDATVFQSHAWHRAIMAEFQRANFVLAARPDSEHSEYVAFFPLGLIVGFNDKFGYYNRLIFAGDQYTDYNAPICLPEYDQEAIPALLIYARDELHWAVFGFDNLRCSYEREQLITKTINGPHFTLKTKENIDRSLKTNQDICPFIDLPDDFESYLATLSSNNRQKFRRLLRQFDASERYRIAISSPETYDADVDVLLRHWRVKWAPSKGDPMADKLVQNNRNIFSKFYDGNNIFVATFLADDKPIAAILILIDHTHKLYHFMITGRDESFTEFPAGIVLHLFAIRHAIEQGMKVYDFIRGDEPYKFLFTKQTRAIVTRRLETRSKRNQRPGLDPRSLEGMLGLAKEFVSGGKREQAELAYQQILEFDPGNAEALYRHGKILLSRGDTAGARAAFERSVVSEPKSDNSWLEIAKLKEAAGDAAGALQAARKAVKIFAENVEAVSIVLRLEAAANAVAPVLKPVKPAPVLDAISATAQKKSGFNPSAFDPGPRVNLDPGLLGAVSGQDKSRR